MRFRNREEAGKLLGETLHAYAGVDTIVYALPRGGVVIGFEVAQALQAPLDLIITRKIGHPGNPEYAACAITEAGELFCDEEERDRIDPLWLKTAVDIELREAKRRRLVYLGNQPRRSAQGKVAIIVDDGVATGLTLQAAIKTIAKDAPQKIIIAVPVISHTIASEWRREGFLVMALEETEVFLGSISRYYDEFPQVSDGAVVRFLGASSHIGETRESRYTQ